MISATLQENDFLGRISIYFCNKTVCSWEILIKSDKHTSWTYESFAVCLLLIKNIILKQPQQCNFLLTQHIPQD